jgi:hypothetical protein
MKCARCNRPLDKVAGYAAGLPVGPVCFKKMFGFVPRAVKSVAVQVNEDQMDLFKGETK